MQSGTSGSYSSRKSCLKFFRDMYKEEGLRGLYRVGIVLIVLWNVITSLG